MKKEEVTKWLTIMKANLNSFPEVSNAKKIEALGEAIRLLKNEQSIDKIDCEHTECRNCINHKYCDYESSSSEIPNKSIEEKCPCYDCEYFVIDGLSHCKIYEGAYGDCRCKNYHKVKQGSNKVNQGLNKSEIPTGSTNTISFKEMTDNLKITAEDIENAEDLEYLIEPLVYPKNDLGVDCISRKLAIRELKESAEHHANDSREEALLRRDRDIIKALPSVTPIRLKEHWIYDKSFANWVCSKCGETPKTIGYVGTGAFMAEHFKYCNHCGAEMEGSEEV